MMNKMMDTKLSAEELAMVNGGDENSFVTAAKFVWGLVTRDPEAIAIEKIIGKPID